MYLLNSICMLLKSFIPPPMGDIQLVERFVYFSRNTIFYCTIKINTTVFITILLFKGKQIRHLTITFLTNDVWSCKTQLFL